MEDEPSTFGLDPDKLARLWGLGSDSNKDGHCPRCGAKLPADAPEGLCPKCRKGTGRKKGSKSTADGSPHLEKPGTTIGEYKLLTLIGEGGMGLVYLAEHQEPVKRRVALKIIKPGMDSKQVIARFEAERQALALLDHPNIAQVYDAGMTKAGRPYFVMEYVKGVPITEHCDREKLSIEERLKLFLQVCDAVQHAHQKGIIHRDIKPSNILVTIHGDKMVPKIIDFGVAKAISQPLTERTLFTEQGQLIGTPEYMSPEQAEMTALDIDTRSDIYSLGVLLYELLTGTLPFDRKTLLRAGFGEIQRIIREEEPPRPSTRLSSLGEEAKTIAERRRTEIVTLARCLHRELEWIPLKAMRKERTHRYRTAADLADDIQNYLDGVPLVAGPESVMYRVNKFVRRNRALVMGAAAVLVVLIAGIVVSTVFAIGQARARAQAEAARGKEAVARAQAEQALEREAAARIQAEQAEKKAQQQRILAEARAYFNYSAMAKEAYDSADIRRVDGFLEACPAELRGWEWYHLKHISDQALLTLKGHEDAAVSVAVSPDGKRIVSGSEDQTVKVWDAVTGAEAMTLRGHDREVICVAFSPDGTRIASSSGDKTIKLWDAATGTEVMTLRGHKAEVFSVEFSPDGKRIVSGCNDGTVTVWDPASGSEVRTLRGHGKGSVYASFSPDGKRIASGGEDNAVRVWDTATGAEVMTLRGHEGWVIRVAFSPDGKRIASSSWDKTIKLWDTQTGTEAMTLRGHRYEVAELAFSADGKRIVSGGLDHTVRVWDAATGAELAMLRGHAERVTAIACSPDGRWIVSGAWDTTVKVWDPDIDVQGLTLRGHRQYIASISFSPDCRRIATASHDNSVKVWDVTSGAELITCWHDGDVYCVVFSPDGRRLASGSEDDTIKVWDAEDGTELMTLRGHGGNVRSVAFSPDGKWIVSGNKDGTLKVWDAVTSAGLLSLVGHQGPVVSVAFSPDSMRIVSGSVDGTVRVWDAASGAEEKTLRWDKGQVMHVAFGPDGKCIFSGSGSGGISIWDVATGEEIKTLPGHGRTTVTRIAFSPDGRRVVSGGTTDLVKIRDMVTGSDMMTLQGHSRWVESVVFSPDGRTIAVGGRDGRVTLIESKVPSDGYRARRVAEAAQRVAAVAEKQKRETWEVVSKAGDNVKMYQEALERARDANNLKPDDWAVLNMLGVAQYRVGVFHDAFRTLTRADKMRSQKGQEPDPANLAFIAMTLHQLKRSREARTALGRLRALFRDATLAEANEERAFLIEAEKLFAGQGTKLYSVWDSIEVGNLQGAVKLIAELRSSSQEESEIAGTLKWLGKVYYNRAKSSRRSASSYAEIVAAYERVVHIDPAHAGALNDLAWSRVASPKAEYRDGSKAVEESTRACELTEWKKSDYLSTLAAAYSEAGDFDSAVKWQNKAIDLLPADKRAELQANYQIRLKLYESARPYHDGGWRENPIAWWKFDETSGSVVVDSSGKGYHGVAVNGEPVWDANGKFGGCIDFDAAYGLAIPKDIFSSIDKAITISVWVNGDSKQPDYKNVILQAGTGADGTPYIVSVYTRWQDEGRVQFHTGYDELDRLRYYAAVEEWAGRWNHYAFVKDSDKDFQRIYINGKRVAEEMGTNAPMAGVDVARIGIAPGRHTDQYIGRLDDLRIYDYALSEDEIKALHAGKHVGTAK